MAVVALILELLPKNLFNAELPNLVLQYLVERSSWVEHVQHDAESAYIGYGNKFALSYLVLFLAFLAVTIYLVWATLRSNPRIQIPAPQAEGKFRRLLIAGSAIVGIIYIQFAWSGLYIGDTKASAMPSFYQTLLWASANWFIVAFLVTLRRGTWLNAA